MHHVAKQLLIIDDDKGIRDQLKWSFDDFIIYTADNRQTAISQFEKYSPSVVTLDLGLYPDQDGESEGFAILQQILNIAPETRVIIVSGSETPDIAKRASKSGAFHYCSKPFQIEKLKQIVESAFQAYMQQNNKKL